MYLSAQLTRIDLCIIETRYENVDPCTIATVTTANWGHCGGGPPPDLRRREGEHECISGTEGKEQGEKAAHQFIMRAYIVCIFIFERNSIFI